MVDHSEWKDDSKTCKATNKQSLQKKMISLINFLRTEHPIYALCSKDELSQFFNANFPFIDTIQGSKQAKLNACFVVCKGDFNHMYIEIDNSKKSVHVKIRRNEV